MDRGGRSPPCTSAAGSEDRRGRSQPEGDQGGEQVLTLPVERATTEVIRTVRARPWGLAVGAVADGEVCLELDPGVDVLTEGSLFQIGSVTKTMTGLLLAQLVVEGAVELSTTVEAILGEEAGRARSVTLLELATQGSGLPRLPPNLDPADPNDPYADYAEGDLLKALAAIEAPEPGAFGYSNFGFMLLGLLLGRAAGSTYPELVESRIFAPLGMEDSRCGVPDDGAVLPGYRGPSRVPWWSLQLPGPGGISSSICDLMTYASAFLDPPASLRDAVELATAEHAPGPRPVGLGWVLQDDIHWHNGGTGGFRSFVAFHRPTRTGIGILVNSHDARAIDRAGFKVLTEMARSTSTG